MLSRISVFSRTLCPCSTLLPWSWHIAHKSLAWDVPPQDFYVSSPSKGLCQEVRSMGYFHSPSGASGCSRHSATFSKTPSSPKLATHTTKHHRLQNGKAFHKHWHIYIYMCVYILRHGLPYCHSLQTFAGEGPQKVGNSHSRSHSAVPGTTSHQALLWPWPSKLSWDAQQKLSRIHGRVIKEFPLEWWFQSTLVGVPNSFSWPCIFCANNYPADPQRSCHQGKIAKRNPRGRGSFF